jgi:drug/metabolite transporter (DMT)-like permease
MAIGATSPFVSGGLAWLTLGEREDWKVVAASLVALGGVGTMVGPSAFGGHVAGALMAFAMTCAVASMLVIVRAKRSNSMLPASCVSAFLSALVVWPLTSATIPTGITMLHVALFGVVQFGLGLVLMTRGARLVTALRCSLLNRLQTVLGPTWVWLAFGEVPPPAVLIGGSIVLVSTIAAALVVDKSPRAAPIPATRAANGALKPSLS